MNQKPFFLDRLFAPAFAAGRSVLWPRWIFLRCLGLIFFSAFYSLAFQIWGLIGSRGILPAGSYLEEVARVLPGLSRFWRVPTLLWLGAGDAALTALVWGGLIASALLVLNVWPRLTIAVCLVCFLSFLSAAQAWIFYATLVPFLLSRGPAFLAAPARWLDPFRIANPYGLFAVMTRARYEIEFQGSRDGAAARVRAVLWQYEFTTPAEKRRTGNWWKRRWLGEYAPGVP